MYDQIASNTRRSWLLIAAFILLIVALGYAASLYWDIGPYAVPVALVVAIVMSWGSYYHSDRIVIAMSSARPVAREAHLHLWNTVEGLSLAAGVPMPRLYLIEDTAPNAFATGRDPQHAALVVTRGLLEKLNRLELEGVVGHEMAHIRNYDIRLMTLVSVLVGTVALLADWMWRGLRWGGRSRRLRAGGPVMAVVAAVAVLLIALSPLIAQLMQLALSRRREFLADAEGARLTRYPEGLASALEKIAADREPLEAANKATAHLYIYNPLRDYKRSALNNLFNTHPPVEERIARLRAM